MWTDFNHSYFIAFKDEPQPPLAHISALYFAKFECTIDIFTAAMGFNSGTKSFIYSKYNPRC